MPRRTKEEAEQTRLRILDAARRTFHERGVSATTLEHIAAAAGVTRGAIYWHFHNKEELLRAMREEVLQPHIIRGDDTLVEDVTTPPLDRLHRFLTDVLDSWFSCEELRQVIEIMNFKCEYVGPLSGDLNEHITHHCDLMGKLEPLHLEAQKRGELRPGLSPRAAAFETACFIKGLVRVTLLQPQDESTKRAFHDVIAAHVNNRRKPR